MKNASGFPRAQELRKGWRGLFSLFLLSLFLSPVFHLQAGVYKWVDENGRVHFSDRPTDRRRRSPPRWKSNSRRGRHRLPTSTTGS
ncbi:MAG: DUF4124 domain-containing protein [Candidatus Thiodiazotropha sp. (ex Ctena orbiculata)]|nr:DUF4124 domain-containing protein [Candidatus Thiodiazotropha taylori]MBT3001292.1 DUF4124 domain-containing protein [Candidatus Thiodiazotropha taylori]MBV2111664.1 DUF4124 domain-containing protein [Candidatus Thiodiazotropha taylori]